MTEEVVVAFIIKDNRVLAENRPDSIFSNRLSFPAGRVQPGENLSNALHREVLEELGVRVSDFKKIHEAFYPLEDGTQLKLHYFTVKFFGDLELKPDYFWLTRKDAGKLSFKDDSFLVNFYLR